MLSVLRYRNKINKDEQDFYIKLYYRTDRNLNHLRWREGYATFIDWKTKIIGLPATLHTDVLFQDNLIKNSSNFCRYWWIIFKIHMESKGLIIVKTVLRVNKRRIGRVIMPDIKVYCVIGMSIKSTIRPMHTTSR